MPNWCDNEVDITGDAEELRQLMAEASKPHYLHEDSEHEVKFLMDNLVPMPPEYLDDRRWWDFRINNWGCKWDLSQQYEDTRVYYEEGDTEAGLGYQTAWSPNREFWQTVSERFPNLTIDLRYVEEGMWFMGQIIYKAGEVVDEVYYDDIPDEVAIQAGAVFGEDGEIDWDESNLNFWEVFPLVEGTTKYPVIKGTL